MSTKFYHLLAVMTVAIWGTTFVWTKLLLQSGLSPAQIFLTRFTIAYLLLTAWMLVRQGTGIFSYHPQKGAAAPRIFRSQSWRDELRMLGLGVLGGSLYFMTENVALLHTTATNTSLIFVPVRFLRALFSVVFILPNGCRAADVGERCLPSLV